MTKKLVSLLFIIALVATTVFAINIGSNSSIFEYKSYSDSQSNTQSNFSNVKLKNSASNGLSTVNTERSIPYSNYNTIFTTNKNAYQPGNEVDVTGATSIAGFNGSVDLSLITPLNEQVVSPTKTASSIFFKDPLLKNSSLVDWNTTSGMSAVVTNNYLNVSSSVATSTNLSYIEAHNDLKGTFQISFKYYRNSTDLINMTLNYWNGTNIVPIAINYGTSNSGFVTFTQTIVLDTTNPAIKALNITLNGITRFIISPITINYNTPSIDFSDGNIKSGSIQYIWVHGNTKISRDNVTVRYYIDSSVSTSKPYVSFNFTLPDYQLYPGEWQFNIKVNPVDSQNTKLNSPHTFIIPISVQYPIYFKLDRQFVYRGMNETNIPATPIYKNETGTTIPFSPSDQIVFAGKLFTNVTGKIDTLDSVYFSKLEGLLFSNTTNYIGNQYLNWTTSHLTGFYANATSSVQIQTVNNLLPTSLQNNFTWLIPETIPMHGIYGSVNQTLSLTIPSLTATNTSTGVLVSTSTYQQVILNPIEVKFFVNVTNYDIPFNRTWFITEFMEGNFSIQSWRYNSSALIANNNAVNQSFAWSLSIPNSDLLFSVYLMNTTGGIEQNFTVSLLSTGYFYFAGQISSNLNTLDSYYHLGITWINPLYSNEKADQLIDFSTNNKANYTIRGTLTVQVPLSTIVFRQGDNLIIHFNVTIDQLNNKPASGLLLNAILLNATSTNTNTTLVSPQIIENDGQYTLLMTLPESMNIGTYTIQIFKASTHTLLATVHVEINPHEIDPKDVTTIVPLIYNLLGSGLIIIALLGFFYQIIRKKMFNF